MGLAQVDKIIAIFEMRQMELPEVAVHGAQATTYRTSSRSPEVHG
jgi:hypothetical protein